MLDLFPQENEDIPLKQAYDELMVASKKDYRRTVAFHKGHY